MAPRLSNDHLLTISKAPKGTLNNFRFGVHLHTTSGLSIDSLRENACRDRFGLARQTLNMARWANKPPSPRYRIVLARSYYAMYHAARVVAYFVEGGDDYEDHKSLPGHIPRDFPSHAQWENDLKNARLERNRADYDPYPKTDRAFARSSERVLGLAEQFLPLVRTYMLRKGCAL